MAQQTFAQLTAPAGIDSAADPAAALKAARLAKKSVLYGNLNEIGVVGTVSWTTGSTPSSLVEVYAWSLVDYDQAQAYIALGQLNSTATGDALTALSEEFYDNARAAGNFTVARILLTDTAVAGPWTFQADSVSFSVGRGGLRYDGFDFAGDGGELTLPRGGSVYVYVRSASAGSVYSQLSAGAVNFFARGSIPGVSVTNDATWLDFTGAVVGSDDEGDASLQTRNAAKWGTLGTGSPKRAYVAWAMGASPTEITRVSVLTNLDILRPGRVDVLLAGPVGAVSSGVVTAAQDAIAPAQIGGDKIPETATAVASSAANLEIAISATIRVQKEYNTAAFQAQVSADYAAFAAATPIGAEPLGIVSRERLMQILTFRAGLNPSVIYDVSDFTPAADVTLAYYQVPIFTLALTWIST